MAATMTMDLTYSQICSLVEQMPREDKYNLYLSLSKAFDISALKRINARNRKLSSTMTEEEVVEECKSAWNDLYGADSAK